MKVAFNISPRFPVREALAKEIARFCITEAKKVCCYRNLIPPAKVSFTMHRSSRSRSGHAFMNTAKKFPHFNQKVFLKLNHIPRAYTERYHRYADSPVCLVDGTLEAYVHLVAHELGHAICGFEGDKIGEFQCERFAAKCLEKWQLKYQPAACMI